MVLWLYTTYYEGALLRPVGEYYGYTLPLTMGRVLWLYTTTYYEGASLRQIVGEVRASDDRGACREVRLGSG